MSGADYISVKGRDQYRKTRAITVLAAASILLAACGGGPIRSGAGGAANDFALVAYQGDSVFGGKNSSFNKVLDQGKPVVLNFWAGLCPPCRAEMPGFQKVSTEFSGKVQFVGIDIGPFIGLGTHDDAMSLYRELGIRYPLAYAVDTAPLQGYKIQGMPTTVFLTQRGEVLEKVTGIVTESQLRSIIKQKLLATS